jgi:protein-tyrosine phosphatase
MNRLLSIKHIYLCLSIALISLFSTLSFTTIASAAEPTDACGTPTNIIKLNCGDGKGMGNNAIWGILLAVIMILTAGIGIVAIGGLIYGAILYTTAQDNSGQITKSKTTIANVVIGLVLYAFMWSLLQFLVPGGVFSNSGGSSVTFTTGTATPETRTANRATSGNSPSSNGGNSSPASTNNPSAVTKVKFKNFRDASASSNGVLKPGILFRSTRLSYAAAEDINALSQVLGSNGLIIDLRTAEQVRKAPDKVVPGVKRVHKPVQGFSDTGVAVTNPSIRKAFLGSFRAMANNPGPVLIHCLAGKDRTGWVIAMIMGISGASRDQIRAEYALSTKAYPDHDPNWINSGLTQIDKKYNGSYRKYLKKGVGLSDAEIDKLIAKFKA